MKVAVTGRLWNPSSLIPVADRFSRVYRGRGELIDHLWSAIPWSAVQGRWSPADPSPQCGSSRQCIAEPALACNPRAGGNTASRNRFGVRPESRSRSGQVCRCQVSFPVAGHRSVLELGGRSAMGVVLGMRFLRSPAQCRLRPTRAASRGWRSRSLRAVPRVRSHVVLMKRAELGLPVGRCHAQLAHQPDGLDDQERTSGPASSTRTSTSRALAGWVARRGGRSCTRGCCGLRMLASPGVGLWIAHCRHRHQFSAEALPADCCGSQHV